MFTDDANRMIAVAATACCLAMCVHGNPVAANGRNSFKIVIVPGGEEQEQRQETEGGQTFFKIQDGVLIGVESNSAETVVVPESVKKLKESSFRWVEGMRTVRLPNGIGEICRGAFVNCHSLEKVSIPASVTNIEARAFPRCDRLSELEFDPESKFEFRNGILFDKEDKVVLFAVTGITNAVIPESTVEIGKWAFHEGFKLKEIVIPEGVRKIGEWAISGCNRLSFLLLPSTLETFEEGAVSDCSSLDRVEIRPGGRYSVSGGFLLADGGKTIVCNFNHAEEIRVPDEITKIAAYAFSDNGALRKIFVPDSVSDIGQGAFARCRKLEELRLPAKVEQCGSMVAQFCRSLGDLAMPEGVKKLDSSTYEGCYSITNIVIPEGVQELWGILCECYNLRRVALPASLKDIWTNFEFHRNPRLEAIEVSPDNPHYKSVDGVLFDAAMKRLIRCPAARQGIYDIPPTVEEIADRAFSGCKALTEVRIPDTVWSIGREAFSGCTARTNLVAATNADTAPKCVKDASGEVLVSAIVQTGNTNPLTSRASFRVLDPNKAEPIGYKASSFPMVPKGQYGFFREGVSFALRDFDLFALYFDSPKTRRESEAGMPLSNGLAYLSTFHVYPLNPVPGKGWFQMMDSLDMFDNPLAVLTLETSKDSDRPFFCAFTPEAHLNFGVYEGETNRIAMLTHFIGFLSGAGTNNAVCLGSPEAGAFFRRGRELATGAGRNMMREERGEPPLPISEYDKERLRDMEKEAMEDSALHAEKLGIADLFPNGAADHVPFGELKWTFGGTDGSGAERQGVLVSGLEIRGGGLSFRQIGDFKSWGPDQGDSSGAMACLFVQDNAGKWVGGKVDSISSSGLSFKNIADGCEGWSLSNIPDPCRAAFVVVSVDGKKRSNVISSMWERGKDWPGKMYDYYRR